MNLESIPLSNGVKMPRLGYGVYQVDPTTCEASVREALEVGYRAIDTAQAYHNEEGVGRAIKGSGLPREDIFLTTKVWVSNAGQEKARASIEESLRKLQTDYIDLLLIHQPFNDYYGTWRAMEEAYKAGKVRAIGVSNFFPDRLVDLCQFVEIRPMVNQVETHALYQQKAAHAIMEKSMSPGAPLPRGGRISSPTRFWRRWGPSTANPWPRSPCGFCCRAMWWSSPNPCTKRGWRKISRSLISVWMRRIWRPSRPWTRRRAPFSPTTTPLRWNSSPGWSSNHSLI